MATEARGKDGFPVAEYVHGEHSPVSHLSHGWELHSAVLLSPAEERTMVREPADAVPESIAQRLGAVRVLIVPYVACAQDGDRVTFSKPEGDTHSAVWLETAERTYLVLPCRELDAHDTGFEFLATVAELLRPRLTPEEKERFTALVEEELRDGVRADLDEDATAAKRLMFERHASRRRHRSEFEHFLSIVFVSTAAEYMHGLWHDVQIQVGPDRLPVPQLRRRMELMAALFPPNEGYRLFDENVAQGEGAS